MNRGDWMELSDEEATQCTSNWTTVLVDGFKGVELTIVLAGLFVGSVVVGLSSEAGATVVGAAFPQDRAIELVIAIWPVMLAPAFVRLIAIGKASRWLRSSSVSRAVLESRLAQVPLIGHWQGVFVLVMGTLVLWSALRSHGAPGLMTGAVFSIALAIMCGLACWLTLHCLLPAKPSP